MTITEQKQIYVEGDNSNAFRIRIKKFIMNYGRYYEIRNIPKELRPKVPKEINVFVKKYTLKRRLSATSFYVFEGEERKELIETLEVFA
ncbi:hypothetical protein PW5551_03985 [Petrotoga sp. 9PW.55.5.1]|uniref:hypothetical protein n=1 Tax=Petrotoga sp. 9PW.55.5.1 TaxID=1308979 RepID=UPI000DC31A73|nr:hypothetical protein [Petrotoga sp. 9PW.55.5.1]RAO99407.1 hypothetical protein PW5551_03985 [Petrotoga sp. 9PW.55.5.1]